MCQIEGPVRTVPPGPQDEVCGHSPGSVSVCLTSLGPAFGQSRNPRDPQDWGEGAEVSLLHLGPPVAAHPAHPGPREGAMLAGGLV